MDKNLPRPASTIVVIRDQDAMLEILMLRRSPDTVAAAGAHVFPGGAVERRDAEVVDRDLVFGLDADAATDRLNLSEGALAYYCAALRELFEEAGLLLAVDASRRPLEVSQEELVKWRGDIAKDSVSWVDLLEREGLRLDLSGVQYLAHWVTPDGRARRFDTRFFVVAAPRSQSALPDYSEVVQHEWTAAQVALDRFKRGEWTLLPPTLRTLRSLLEHDDVAGVLGAAANAKVTRIQPREIVHDGRKVVVVPGEPGYDD